MSLTPETRPTNPLAPHSGAVLSVYAIAVGAVLVLMGLFKTLGLPVNQWPTKGNIALIVGTLGVLGGVALTAISRRSFGRENARQFWIAMVASGLSVVVAFLAAEVTVRLAMTEVEGGWQIGEVVLPRTWREQVERNRAVISEATQSGRWDEPMTVFDPELGWKIASGRATLDGMYASSAEGIRSGTAGEVLFNREHLRRVALIGDSNAYSLEVKYEESWGYHLERELGPDTQVLNFGVHGYGVDQTLLHYSRDVAGWHPDVVVMEVIQSDVVRTMGVYAFITFPTWDVPFSKPRYDVSGPTLRRINPTLLRPEDIVGYKRIELLPYIEYDYGYNWNNWGWRAEWAPFLWRYFTSAFPRQPSPLEIASNDRLVEVNVALMREMALRVERSGAKLLLIYLPTVGVQSADENLIKTILNRSGIEYADMRGCLEALPAASLYVKSGHHFSALANLALARCTAVSVRRATDVALEGGSR